MRCPRDLVLAAAAALLVIVAGGDSTGLVAAVHAAPRASEAATAAALISRYRSAHGLGPVKVDARLNAAAAHQARAAAASGSLSHGDFAGRMAAFGIGGGAAENLSAGIGTVEGVIAQWRASSGHNANLLMPHATRIGLARVDAPGSAYRHYWALVLAR